MKIEPLIDAIHQKVTMYRFRNMDVNGLTDDSRRVRKGSVFVAVKGVLQDGHRFIPEAIKKGASAVVLSDRKYLPEAVRGVAFFLVEDPGAALVQLAGVFFGHPEDKIKCVGITGTNGKTTVSYLAQSVLEAAGRRCGIIGTIGYQTGHKNIPMTNTTPGVLELHRLLREMVRAGDEYVAMEVSSHALDQGRVAGVVFQSALFTNLTRDHLDYHKTVAAYFQAKKKLFTRYSGPQTKKIINIDDPYGRRLFDALGGLKSSYGFSRCAQFRVECFRLAQDGSWARLRTPTGPLTIRTKLVGRHNLYNILAAVAFGAAEGLAPEVLRRGVERVANVPGRLDAVSSSRGFRVFVDYAHTDDALKNVLESLRAIAHNGRIITVFGCGGDRDKGKRPKMGRVATDLSDFCVITSDNPRSEDPHKIIAQIVRGTRKKNFDVQPDRGMAIEKALRMASAQDVVLIAGKGHETYQIVKDKVLSFDDKATVVKVLRRLEHDV